MDQPLAVAVDASSTAFRFYKSGVVTKTDGCTTGLNHAVVIVGYSDDSDDKPDPTPPTPPTPTPTADCTVDKWWHECDNVSSYTGRQNLTNENNNYWKVQNSWGS